MTNVNEYLMTGPDAERYYRQTEQKHFPKGASSSVGSEFRDEQAPDLRSLLELAAAQRGGLEGDDHHVLGDPGRPGVYYLAVEVNGVNGALPASELPAQAGVLVLRSKEGVPPDYLVFGVPRPETTMGTLVMADERDPEGQPTGKRILITCHPGMPMPPAGAHREEVHENTVLAASAVGDGETILVGDVSHVGGSTIGVLEAMLNTSVETNEEMGQALSQVANLPDELRKKAQEVLYEAWRIDDGYYFDAYNTDLVADLNSDAALKIGMLIAENASKSNAERSRMRLPGVPTRDPLERASRAF